MASNPPPRSPVAGGSLIALGAIGGAAVGLALHQPTTGFLIGITTGVALAVVIWFFSRQ